jgi:hypothetical protein
MTVVGAGFGPALSLRVNVGDMIGTGGMSIASMVIENILRMRTSIMMSTMIRNITSIMTMMTMIMTMTAINRPELGSLRAHEEHFSGFIL